MQPRGVEAIEAAVRAGGLLEAGHGSGPVLLLCSAGRDSACLLDLAAHVLGPDRVRVLHVDHGLRPESRDDAGHLMARAGELGVQAVVRGVASSPPQSGNLHAWAREARAQHAEVEARRVGARVVASAHTRTDLVETALFRLATQPGRRALLAMRDREPGGVAPGVDLVRPLLAVSRDDTRSWCEARGVRWREDRSNADRRFARGRLRHSVTPVLRSLNPRYEEAVERTLHDLEAERAALDALVMDALPPGRQSVTVPALHALPRPVARLVFRELCERTAGRPCARAAGRLDELLDRALADRRPFAMDVGDGVRVAVRSGIVRCERSSGPAAVRTEA